jgi:uncharacterized repeat protein (TIGR01451 family)
MNKLVSKSIIALSIFTVIASFASSATAAPPAPNLSVLAWQGSASPMVESPYQYTSRVRNIGNQTAQNVTITVELPQTNTSPTRHILGKLTSYSASSGTCSIVARKIVCNVGSLNNNQTKSVTFTFEFQVATNAPVFKTTATTGSTNEQNPNNNILAFAPTLAYPDNVITGGTYLATHCTGTNLTSFYECELYPSSQQSFTMDLNSGGAISIPNEPLYSGFWDQNNLPFNKTLHFTLDGPSGTEAEFNGFAVSSTCFEGITTFPQSSAYNSAYKVCLQ